MNIKVDMGRWLAEFDQQAKAALAVSNKVQVEASRELLNRVEKRTPVGDPTLWKSVAPSGYKPGTLRASWSLDFKQTSSVVLATLSNDQPYAERVEYGWSSQAPAGMLRISLKEWNSIISDTTKKNRLVGK